MEESDNFEFELLIQFNHKKCWALYSCLNRFIYYDNSEYKGSPLKHDVLKI